MSALVAWVESHPDILLRTGREHLVMSLAALALAVAVAVPLGIALVRRPGFAGPVVGAANVLRTIPSLALLVVMLPAIGTGMAPSIVALVLYGLPAVLLNTMAGLGAVSRETVDAARGQGLSEGQILRAVELPLAAPVILGGVRTAAVQIVSAATLAVFVGGGGFGELISAGMGLLEIPQLLAGTIAVALLAGLAEGGFALAELLVARRVGAPVA